MLYQLLVVKDTTPGVLKSIISQFVCLFNIISTLATYFNKKLRTMRRFTKPESDFRFVQFFLYTCIASGESGNKKCEPKGEI